MDKEVKSNELDKHQLVFEGLRLLLVDELLNKTKLCLQFVREGICGDTEKVVSRG